VQFALGALKRLPLSASLHLGIEMPSQPALDMEFHKRNPDKRGQGEGLTPPAGAQAGLFACGGVLGVEHRTTPE
jgi:hypothetical protein